jgi:chromatin remodeling complex protein RSC6
VASLAAPGFWGRFTARQARFLPLKTGGFHSENPIAMPRAAGINSTRMAKKSPRKPNAAFMKPVQPNEALAAVVGSNPLPRTELTKKLWAYIKKNGLQDKKVKTRSMPTTS